ncbi:MAG: tetratricopeptide repeat protein [Burkholderiales bacterium]|jgi:tetratricopeptide (TPR) repeat protein|nr:tetratricopeptide repeat protein [Burkholderiales bacterium]
MATLKVLPKRSARNDEKQIDRLDQAQMLMYDAWEAPTPAKAKALARKALKLSEDCADAYTFLSRFAKTDAEALSLLYSAVEAGERALGPRAFKDMTGMFWGVFETRPYMRALNELAQCLIDMNRLEEAVDCFQRMLHLNPNDNQGVRYELLPLFMALDRDADAETLYKKYKDEISSFWLYDRALLDYRKHGAESPIPKKSLKKAFKGNPHIAAFLSGRKEVPDHFPEAYTLGSEEEAAIYVSTNTRAWIHRPDALFWLVAAAEEEKI